MKPEVEQWVNVNVKNCRIMDNSEILKGMGFEYVTDDLWQRNDMGFIKIPKNSNLNYIACRIFESGQNSAQEKMQKALGIK
jgi:hypothetical protein